MNLDAAAWRRPNQKLADKTTHYKQKTFEIKLIVLFRYTHPNGQSSTSCVFCKSFPEAIATLCFRELSFVLWAIYSILHDLRRWMRAKTFNCLKSVYYKSFGGFFLFFPLHLSCAQCSVLHTKPSNFFELHQKDAHLSGFKKYLIFNTLAYI